MFLINKRTNFFFFLVEVIASLGNFGISVGFPGGYIKERFGARVAAFCGLILSVTGFLLLWSTTLMKDFYREHVILQYIYYFIAGKTFLLHT